MERPVVQNTLILLRSFGAVLAGAVVFSGGLAMSRTEPENPARWSIAQWTSWRDAEIARILEPNLPYRGEKVVSRQDVIDRSVEPYVLVSRCLQQDPAFFSPSSERGQEMGHFVDFVTAQHWMALKGPDGLCSNALGYEISDRRYAASAGANLKIPALLTSQDFLSEVGSPATYKAAVDRIEANNASQPEGRKWIVLPFLSRFIKSADKTTYGRILVLVPNEPAPGGGVLDKWIMFAIAAPDAPPTQEIRSVSMVAVHRETPEATKTQSFLMDFLREKNPSTGVISVVPTAFMRENPSNNCYDCHKAAVIPIKPELEYSFDRDGNLAVKSEGVGTVPQALNNRIAGYGQIDLGVQSADSYGPSLGPAVPRSIDFIRKASGMELSDDSAQRIRSAMTCAGCHNSFAKINYPQAIRGSRDIKAFKTDQGLTQTFVEKGWMPPGNTLTARERRALWLCLTTEYYDPKQKTGLLVEWLKGKG